MLVSAKAVAYPFPREERINKPFSSGERSSKPVSVGKNSGNQFFWEREELQISFFGGGGEANQYI